MRLRRMRPRLTLTRARPPVPRFPTQTSGARDSAEPSPNTDQKRNPKRSLLLQRPVLMYNLLILVLLYKTPAVFLLSKNFTRWVFAANVVAWPLSYFILKKFWLVNFPFRITLNLWIFISVGLLSLLIALLTVGFQSVRAALANPADSLRTE